VLEDGAVVGRIFKVHAAPVDSPFLRVAVPNRSHAFEDALTLAGSPDPRNDRICITSLCPRQFLITFCLLLTAKPPATTSAP
jgi:hypothetical protein